MLFLFKLLDLNNNHKSALFVNSLMIQSSVHDLEISQVFFLSVLLLTVLPYLFILSLSKRGKCVHCILSSALSEGESCDSMNISTNLASCFFFSKMVTVIKSDLSD